MLRDALPHAELVDGSGFVSTVKITKSQKEIEYLREAARITDAGILAAIEAAGAGKTDNDVAAAGNQALFEAGSEYMCLSPIVTSGRRSGILHSTHKRIPLAKGDSLCMEFGASFQRYTSPMMRTVSIGKPEPDIARLANACLTALNNVIATMKPGITADEVAKAGWDGIDMAGPDLVFHGAFAYAVGAGFPPGWGDSTAGISLGNFTRLQPGMVFHHPVALRRIGEYGTMFSETTLITDDGCEALTNVERKLFIK
jgi:Xaa-Pro aminopeptidase